MHKTLTVIEFNNDIFLSFRSHIFAFLSKWKQLPQLGKDSFMWDISGLESAFGLGFWPVRCLASDKPTSE